MSHKMTSISDNQSRPHFSNLKETWRQLEDTESNIVTNQSNKMETINSSVIPQINKKLDFDISDGYDEEDEDHSGARDDISEVKNKTTKSRSSDGVIRKRIDFGSSEDDLCDRDPSPIRHLDFDSDSEEDSESEIHRKKQSIISSAFKTQTTLPIHTMKERKVASESCICIRSSPHRAMQFGDYKQPQYSFNSSLDCKINPSPHRTRSGRIYTSGDSPAMNEYCQTCKPQAFLTDSHPMPPASIPNLKQLPAKRPFHEDSIEHQTGLVQEACSSDNVHLNLLQSDLVNEIAAKRPKRNNPENVEHLNMYDEGRNTCMSDSSTNVLPDTCQPEFELPPPTIDAPPPLEYVKRPVSRLSLIREKMQLKKKEEQLRLRTDLHLERNKEGTPECHVLHRFRTPSFESYDAFPSPGYIYQTPTNQHSPPTNEVRAMRIFDSNSPKGHRIPPCDTAPKFRIPFESLEDAKEESSGHQRRRSAPGGVENSSDDPPFAKVDRFRSEQTRKRQKRVANINPFTPTPTFDSIKRRKTTGISFISQTSGNNSMNAPSLNSSINRSFPACLANVSNCSSITSAHDSSHEMIVDYERPKTVSGPDGDSSDHNPSMATEQKDLSSKDDFVFHPPEHTRIPTKRLRVSDINVTRYEEEFVEIEELASGVFGKVMVARHRLDGMVYAIKITKKQIFGNTHQERVTMNEVFAHSALIKHKHVVRYYNSWVESGRVYIQNEFCEGGSLGNRIDELREENHNTNSDKRFPECELKKILLHAAKGLQYIHSKGLVHLDVKPENIFITLEHASNSPSPNSHEIYDEETSSTVNSQQTSDNIPRSQRTINQISQNQSQSETGANTLSSTRQRNRSGHDSTDSGNGSGCDVNNIQRQFTGVINPLQCSAIHRELSSSPGTPDNMGCPYSNGADRVSYKIGDLGHVVPIRGEYNPEEGDCRYMAPELLSDEINREYLTKADIFSLGLAIYEAATLRKLPKNSLEDPSYENIKSGNIPSIDGYSKEFNALIKSMIHPDPVLRPNASRLVTLVALRSNGANSKSRSQLYKELRDAREKLKILAQELENEKRMRITEQKATSSPEFPTPPKDKETSSSILLSPITMTSNSSDKPASENRDNFAAYMTRSKDVLELNSSMNLTSNACKETSSTPKRNDRRTNLRKRTLIAKKH